LYSRSGSLPNIPALSQEYRVEMEDTWEGAAYFDGKHLWGYFLPKHLSPEALADLRSLPIHFGRFAAKLRDDGSFAVIIEQWDGQPPKKLLEGFAEPGMIQSETEWYRSN
jgi:hypothetical protein